MTMSVDTIGPAAVDRAWYKSLSRAQWNVLIASNLGWLFDGFENYALILTAGPALRQLLDVSHHAQLPFYIGVTIGINLLGWGIGGMFGGIAADLHRERTGRRDGFEVAREPLDRSL